MNYMKLSILIPCFNEEDNVKEMHDKLTLMIREKLSGYSYEIIFIDNKSSDRTRDLLTLICQTDSCTKAIYNVRNFGQFNSPYYGILQSTGDCTILLSCDFQDPIELIPRFVEEWEKGFKIVIGIKTSSNENKLIYFLRSIYYKTIKKMSDIEQIEHFTGFGLYDKSFVDVLRGLDDPTPFLRGIVAELGFERKDIPYTQERRKNGKTHNNWYTLYDAAMLSFTSYTKIGLRIATFGGFIIGACSMIIALFYFVMKLIWWNNFNAGTAPLIIGVFFMFGIQLFFIGLIGEYILNLNARIMKRPLVIEEKRINFHIAEDN